MPTPRVPAPVTTVAQRRLLFQTWQQTRNVTLACRTARVGRRTFYYWKPRFLAGGYAALDTVASSARKQPHHPAAVAEQVVALRRAHPQWGKRRIAQALAAANGGGPVVSATTVQRLLVAAGLWTPRAVRGRRPSTQTAHRGDAHLPVVATKLTQPRAPATLVKRARLVRVLDGVYDHRMTLLAAAAGWGKTTLVSAWARGQAHPVAWLSLEPADDDPVRFWIAVLAAVRTCRPALGAVALAMLEAPEPAPLTAVLTVLLNDLAAAPADAPLVVIFDDYHMITDGAIHESVAFVIERLPPHVSVLIATRVDPELPLARWRARGALLELRAAELAFTPDEAASFFSQALDVNVADDDVQRLHQRTEGWIAGLLLAALALRQAPNRAAFVTAFTGSHRYLLDYVQEEILHRQSPAVQQFVLYTAVLRHLNASLCAAVTSDADSQAILELLERSNLFVVPLDDQRRWYRMHDLVREVLLARLEAMEPQLLPLLHRRAAHWYAAHDDVRAAITHALAAHDFGFAAELITRIAPQLWLRGDAPGVQTWIAALPDPVVHQHACLALDAALHLFDSGYAGVANSYRTIQTAIEHTLARVAAGLDTLPAAEATVLRRRVGLLQALLAARTALMGNDAAQMQLIAARSAALAQGEELPWRLAALGIAFWHVEAIQREGALLIPQLLDAKQQVIAAGDYMDTVRVLLWLAFAYVRAGRLRAAEAECRAALALMERTGRHSSTTGYFYLYLAWIYGAFNQLDMAASALQQVLEIARTWQHIDLLIVGHGERMTLALARGDHTGAEQALLETEALHEHERVGVHTSYVLGLRVAYWLATGNFGAAGAWAEQVDFSPQTWHPNRRSEFLLLIRVYLAQAQYTRALAALQAFSSYLDRAGDRWSTISFLAVHVLALQGVGDVAHAHAMLRRLLTLAAEENQVRAFLDAGAPMRRALQQVRDQTHDTASGLPSVTDAFIARVLAAFEQQAQHAVRSMPNGSSAGLRARLAPSNAPIEPLTRREREVLRLLVAGASNADIAGALVITVATAKKHVSSLLGKLGVATRAQAVARVREAPDLLEP